MTPELCGYCCTWIKSYRVNKSIAIAIIISIGEITKNANFRDPANVV